LHIPCHVSWGRAFARRPRRVACHVSCGMSCVPCDGAHCMSYRLSAGLIPLRPRATLKRLACGASAREWPTLSPGRHQDRTGHARTHARTHAHKTLGLLIPRTVPCLRVSSRPSAPTHMPHHAHIYLPSTRQTKCARGSVGWLCIVWAAACCIGYCMGRGMLHWVLYGPQHVALGIVWAAACCIVHVARIGRLCSRLWLCCGNAGQYFLGALNTNTCPVGSVPVLTARPPACHCHAAPSCNSCNIVQHVATQRQHVPACCNML
jgi:hypothetical protein